MKSRKTKKAPADKKKTTARGTGAENIMEHYLDTVNVLLIILDKKGRVKKINRAGCRILGVSKKEIEGRDWFRIVAEENRKDVRRVFEEAVKKGTAPAPGYESVLTDAKGKKKYMIWNSFVLKDENGAFNGLMGSGQDITREKENRLKINKAMKQMKLKSRYNELRLKLWEAASGEELAFEKNIKKMLGMAGRAMNCDRISYNVIKDTDIVCIDEWRRQGVRSTINTKLPMKFVKHMITDRVVEVVPENAAEKAPAFIRSAVKKIIKNYAKKIKLKTVLLAPFYKNNELTGTITADICTGNIRKNKWEEEDRVMMLDLMNIISSVLTRETAMKELNENEKKFRVLFESAPDAYYLNDMKGTFLDGNSAAEKLTGIKKEKLIGMDFGKSGILPRKYLPQALGNLVKNAAGKETGPDEWEIKNASGELIPVEISSKPVEIAGRKTIIGIARDISGRKKAEKEISLSHKLLNATMDGVFVHDMEGRIIYVNDAACRERGYKKEELLGMRIHELDVPEYAKNIKKHIMTIKKEGQAIFETAHYRKDRTIMPVEIHSRLIDIESTPHILSVTRDTTERKRWEEEIRGRMDELDRILDTASNGMRVISTDGMMLKVNKKFCDITGYTEDELIGKKCSIIKTSRCQSDDCTLKKTLAGGKVEDEEVRTKKKHGEMIICLVNAGVLKDSKGTVKGVVEEYKDITERKIYEQQLELNKRILSVINDSVFLHTPSGNMLFMNEAAYRQRGYEKHELFLKGFAGIAEKYGENIIRELKEKGSAVYEDVHEKKDGSKMDVEINSTMVELGSETAVLSVARDITERKRSEAQLEKSYEKLKELDALKTNFTHMITHELRTPITSIKGYSSFILGGASGDINEKTREFLRIVENNSERLLKLINDLLDVAKIESGGFSIEKQKINAESIIDDVIKTLNNAAEEKKITLVKKEKIKNAEITADEYRVNQVVLNLVSNALKFSYEGSKVYIGFEPDFKVSGALSPDKSILLPGKYARIYVKDEGKGLEKKEAEKIFERFAQAGGAVDRKKGTGLGLSIARGIARAHNGDVWAESEGRGKGTVFSFVLPLDARKKEGENEI